MVAQQTGLDMEQSFVRFRAHARNHNLRLADVARSLIEGDLNAETLDELASMRSVS